MNKIDYQSLLILTAVKNDSTAAKKLKQAKSEILSTLGTLYAIINLNCENLIIFDRALTKKELQWIHETYNCDIDTKGVMVVHLLADAAAASDEEDLLVDRICLTGDMITTNEYNL